MEDLKEYFKEYKFFSPKARMLTRSTDLEFPVRLQQVLLLAYCNFTKDLLTYCLEPFVRSL